MTFEELWRTLEDEARGLSLSGIQRRRVHPASSRDIYAGFKKPDNSRVFLIRVAKEALPLEGALPLLKGVETFAAQFPPDVPTHASLGLVLREARYADVFTTLVEDMASNIAVQTDDEGAVQAFLTRLGKWQKFLESHSEGLSEEARQGLYGELKFLRDHVLPRLGVRDVSAWTGAHRTPQDFQFSGHAVEVKTSIAKQLQTLRISNERQLDDTHLEALFLYHLSLEPLRGTGETLPQMIASLRSLIADGSTARTQLEDALIEVGYLDAHAPRYAATGYSIREENLFRVREGFPRLIESNLPAGVGDVTYSISVTECQHFAVAFASLDDLLLPKSQNAGSTQGSSD